MAKGKKTGGRSSGTPNKATQDIRKLAQDYGDEAINTLREIMNDKAQPAAARVAASEKLLDRGYGKAIQSLKVGGELGIKGIKRVIVDPANRNAKGIRPTS
ncbi:hypothetical protein [Dyella mobilis]|uniref:Uncharacterized protein n=1 Tax=Dyella mobilis TaxID=1849582 RepID=A0ABS2KK74_9GAMM|nr:hypothetical protein [Dyella mobilis]MBM7131565.1 hypothetical protein [Dyella mobilis]GLQ96463.1 hypothetical protein GCM10007863_08810 [Dyella mobilis]